MARSSQVANYSTSAWSCTIVSHQLQNRIKVDVTDYYEPSYVGVAEYNALRLAREGGCLSSNSDAVIYHSKPNS